MSYSISGTTITVSGTVDLTNTTLGPIYRIVFGAGGASVTFDAMKFFALPPQGTDYQVVGSAAADVLTININPLQPVHFIDLSSFRFQNWSAGDMIV